MAICSSDSGLGLGAIAFLLHSLATNVQFIHFERAIEVYEIDLVICKELYEHHKGRIDQLLELAL